MRAWGAVMVAALLAAGRAEARPGPARAAPALSLPDLDGRRVTLADLRGRVVVVNFWATWCVPCTFEIPGIAALWRREHAACLDVLGIAEDSGGREPITRAARQLHIPYPVLLDRDGAVARRYRVPGFPFTFVIDRAGRVRRVFDGYADARELEAAVRPLLPPPGEACLRPPPELEPSR